MNTEYGLDLCSRVCLLNWTFRIYVLNFDFRISQGARGEALLAHWRSHLAEPPPPLALPLDKVRGRHQTFAGDAVVCHLPHEPG